MDAFNYRDGELFAEGVALSAIAERFGTPTYQTGSSGLGGFRDADAGTSTRHN